MMVGLLGIYGIYYGLDGNDPTTWLLVLAVSFIGHGISRLHLPTNISYFPPIPA
jgi:hypothetical protein